MEQFLFGVTEFAGYFLVFALLLIAVVQALSSIPATVTWLNGDRRISIWDTAVAGWAGWLIVACLVSILYISLQ